MAVRLEHGDDLAAGFGGLGGSREHDHQERLLLVQVKRATRTASAARVYGEARQYSESLKLGAVRLDQVLTDVGGRGHPEARSKVRIEDPRFLFLDLEEIADRLALDQFALINLS